MRNTEEVIQYMKNSGIVKYENYNGCSAKGMKNKRTKKRELLRAKIREEEREKKKRQQKKAYSKPKEYGEENSW